MEYISALLYIRFYEKGKENFEKIEKERENFYICQIIDKIIEEIRQEINDEKLFSDIQFKNITFYRDLGEKNMLSIIIKEIGEISEEYDKTQIAEAYEFAIEQSAMLGDMERTEEIFYTPKEIVNIMAKMILKKENAKLYDPMYSSGNFLIKAMEQKETEIFGEEKNIEYDSIFKTRILLKEAEENKKEYKINKEIEHMKFDYALMNPPFSQRNWKKGMVDTTIIEEYELPENAVADYAYVLKTLEKLEENGKMGAILPHGVLFRENEKKVRETLIQKNQIEAIIGLPENLFYNTRIPVIILVVAKTREDDTVLFIDASQEFVSEKRNNVLTKEQQDKILKVYQNKEQVEGYSRIVTKEEIENNDFNLSIKKYIRKKQEKTNLEITQIRKQIKNLKEEKDILEQNMKDILTVLEVHNLTQIFNKVEKVEEKKETKQKEKYHLDFKKIGKKIKETRRKKGYTLEKMAEYLEVSCSYIATIENGMSGISLKLLIRICNLLEVSIEEIIM